MKGKVKTIVLLVLFAALCAIGIYALISSAATLASLLNRKDGFVDSFRTTESAICAVCLSAVITAAAIIGIVSCIKKLRAVSLENSAPSKKNILLYIALIVLLLCNIAFCIFLLTFGNEISDPPVAAICFVGIAASIAAIIFCAIRLVRKKR